MKIFKEIGTLFLAGLILLTSSGFTINQHFCMGKLKEISINSEPAGCMMKTGISCSLKTEIPSTPEGDCCQDKIDIIDSDEYQKVSKINFSADLQLEFIIQFLVNVTINPFHVLG